MKAVRCSHVWIPKRQGECRQISAQERRVAWKHPFLTEEWIQRQFAEYLLVLIVVRMFKCRSRTLREREKDVIRMIQAMHTRCVERGHEKASQVADAPVDAPLGRTVAEPDHVVRDRAKTIRAQVPRGSNTGNLKRDVDIEPVQRRNAKAKRANVLLALGLDDQSPAFTR